MKIVIAVPVWGAWLRPWVDRCLPMLRDNADDVQAEIVCYTTKECMPELSAIGIRCIQLPERHGMLDHCDAAHEMAINDAFRGDYAVAPLTASLFMPSGMLANAACHLQADGYRAAISLCLPYSPPVRADAGELSDQMVNDCGFLTWDRRDQCSHPGHYAWRCDGGVLVRPFYVHPVLIRPTRELKASRAVDHFMTQECLDTPDQMICMRPCDGVFPGIQLPSPRGGGPVQDHPMDENTVATWMFNGNVRSWNVEYFRNKFWLGCPDEDDRIMTEAQSDAVVNEIVRRYEAMVRR